MTISGFRNVRSERCRAGVQQMSARYLDGSRPPWDYPINNPNRFSNSENRFGLYLFGAGDRTRTGTPSLAADFEGIESFSIQRNVVEPSGVFHLTKHIKPIHFHLKKLDF